MKTLTTKVARILFAMPFGIFGLMHLMGADKMTGMVPIPGGAFWVYITGLALMAAAIAIIINKKGKMASLLLALMLLMFIMMIHIPGAVNAANDQLMMMAMSSMLKDLGLMGGALTYAGISKQ